jgi:hypothetical protein
MTIDTDDLITDALAEISAHHARQWSDAQPRRIFRDVVMNPDVYRQAVYDRIGQGFAPLFDDMLAEFQVTAFQPDTCPIDDTSQDAPPDIVRLCETVVAIWLDERAPYDRETIWRINALLD